MLPRMQQGRKLIGQSQTRSALRMQWMAGASTSRRAAWAARNSAWTTRGSTRRRGNSSASQWGASRTRSSGWLTWRPASRRHVSWSGGQGSAPSHTVLGSEAFASSDVWWLRVPCGDRTCVQSCVDFLPFESDGKRLMSIWQARGGSAGRRRPVEDAARRHGQALRHGHLLRRRQ